MHGNSSLDLTFSPDFSGNVDMLRSLIGLALIISLSFSTAASALSVGEIELSSALNQPFNADVALTASKPEEIETVKVSLASQEAFDNYGLGRPEFLSDIRFSVRRTGASDAVLELRGSLPVLEPFLTLLVKFSWSSGNLLREYTVLLDPPVFDTVVNGAPVEEAVISAPMSAATPEANSQAGIMSAAAAPVVPASSAQKRSAPATVNRQPQYSGETYGPIRNGQSLWAIADRVRGGTDASVNQMMVALFRANPEAFMGNINRLNAGSILRVPSAPMEGLSRSEATAEVFAQKEAWRSGGTVSPPAQTPAQPAQLKLVAPSASNANGDGVAAPGVAEGSGSQSGEIAALRDGLEEAQRLLQVRDAELQALQQRLAELEGSLLAEGGIDDSAMVEELPIDELADDGEVVADMDATGLVDEADVEVEEVVEEVPAETTVVTSSKSGGSVIDTVLGVLGNIWLWIGLAVVVVVGLVFFRSKKAAPAIGSLFDEDDMAPAAREDRGAPIAQALPEGFEPSSFNPSMVVEESLAEEFLNGPVDSSESALDGDAETASSNSSSGLAQSGDLNDDKTPFENTVGSETTINLDNSDPIAQADFHLAYGLYDQAADILVKALEDEPENKIARVKLLEVYFVWENEQGFIGEARKLHQQVGGEANSDWNKVVIMGKQICPEDPLFEGQSEGVGGSQILDIALDSTPASDQLDMNLGEAADEGLDLDFGNDGDFQYEGETFDFDVGANDAPTMETPTIEAPGSESPTMEMPGSESPTMETPTIEMPTASSDSASISLDDLGIDLGDLDELLGDDDLAATQNNLREDPAADESDVVDPTLTMLAGKIDISVTSLEDSDDAYDASANTETLAIDSVEDGDDSDIGTKLDLARAYIEMSDPEGARSILSEVLEEGDSSEQDEARRLLEQLD